MAEMEINLLTLTTHFLEKCLHRKVQSFSVTAGTNPGDNYMSSVYCIDVEALRDTSDSQDATGKQETETIHLFCKCLTDNDLHHQRFLNAKNFFWKELSMYNTWVPEIIKFQEGFLSPEDVLIPAFPPFVSGKAIDFSAYSEDGLQEMKLMKPLEQHIMLMDMRKSKGFQMSNMKITMTKEEVSIALEEICKIHALSWSYQQKSNTYDLPSIFPFLKFKFDESRKRTWLRILETNFKIVLDIIEFNLGIESPVYQGTVFVHKNLQDLLEIFKGRNNIGAHEYLRIKPPLGSAEEKDIAWEVMIHGDYWVNNLLFRRNPEGGKPEEVCIVDLPTFRVGCCTVDFINLIYTSTDASFQELYFDEMAELYVHKFNEFCNILKVDPLPGFTLDSFKARLHTAKLYGYILMVMSVPFQLMDTEDAPKVVFTNSEDGKGLGDGNSSTTNNKIPETHEEKSHIKSVLMRDRIVGIASMLYNEGII